MNSSLQARAKAFLCSNLLSYILLFAFVSFLFNWIFGFRLLIPSNIDWILDYGDLEQNYLGSVAYRLGEWKFPIGNTDFLLYPHSNSVIYTDSIPLLCLITKLLPFPARWQFFGVWGYLMFVFQAMLGMRISFLLSRNRMASMFCGGLCCLVPCFLQRVNMHSSLSAHFVLLLAIYVYVSQGYLFDAHAKSIFNNYRQRFSLYYCWGGLAFLSASIHPYFVLMCGIILVGNILSDFFITRKIYRGLFVLVVYSAVSLLTFIMWGWEPGDASNADRTGFGTVGFNLLSYINPLYQSSSFINELPNYGNSAENFAYLGLGVFFLVLIAVIIMFVFKPNHIFNSRKEKAYVISGTIVFCIATIFATSPVVTVGEKVIIEIPVSDKIVELWSIFRATGRVIWINVYFIIFAAIRVIAKADKKKLFVFLIMMAVVLMLLDIRPFLQFKKESIVSYDSSGSMIADEEKWNDIVIKNHITHVAMLDNYDFYNHQRFDIALWALDNGLTINQFALARNIGDLRFDNESFVSGTLYITARQEIFNNLNIPEMIVFATDGVFLGYIQ